MHFTTPWNLWKRLICDDQLSFHLMLALGVAADLASVLLTQMSGAVCSAVRSVDLSTAPSETHWPWSHPSQRVIHLPEPLTHTGRHQQLNHRNPQVFRLVHLQGWSAFIVLGKMNGGKKWEVNGNMRRFNMMIFHSRDGGLSDYLKPNLIDKNV